MVEENTGYLPVEDHINAIQTLATDKLVMTQSGYLEIFVNNDAQTPVYYDNLSVTRSLGSVIEVNAYYPYGMIIPNLSIPALYPEDYNGYKYNAKELQTELNLNWLDYGARMYDPFVFRFWAPDPLAENHYNVSPYAFCSNNPINRIDPDGLTDFAMNKRTGEIRQIGEANDELDRMLKTDRFGEVKYKKNGEAKVAFDGIEKGILEGGRNFQERDNIIAVGGEGQASVEGVKSFTLQLSEYVGKEIKGFSYSSDGSGKATDMLLGKYKNNDLTHSNGNLSGLIKKYGDNYSSNNVVEQFHTHPDGKLGATQEAPHLSKDVELLQTDKPQIPNAIFNILYRVPGQVKPAEYPYTHHYRPKK